MGRFWLAFIARRRAAVWLYPAGQPCRRPGRPGVVACRALGRAFPGVLAVMAGPRPRWPAAGVHVSGSEQGSIPSLGTFACACCAAVTVALEAGGAGMPARRPIPDEPGHAVFAQAAGTAQRVHGPGRGPHFPGHGRAISRAVPSRQGAGPAAVLTAERCGPRRRRLLCYYTGDGMVTVIEDPRLLVTVSWHELTPHGEPVL